MINMDINSSFSTFKMPVLLGKPFLKIVRTVIDIDKEFLTLRHKDKTKKFMVFGNPTTAYLAFPSSVHFQGGGQSPNLGMLDGDLIIFYGYG